MTAKIDIRAKENKQITVTTMTTNPASHSRLLSVLDGGRDMKFSM